ncbi:MAG: PQQ-binding-like beta-propeller repeat protein [Burkholderiales bacterium]|nr:PQQ-binding-like beta-propeller repeat protein [Burkholderiales bacterium]
MLTIALTIAHTIAALLLAGDAALAQSMFRGDAAHSGVQPSAAPRQFLRVKWSFPTGDRVVSSPAWHDGALIFGSDDGHVYAVDATSGRQRWAQRTGGPVPSSPAVADGRVYIASYDGRLYALDARNGDVLWKFATEGERRFEARGLHGQRPRAQTFADPFDVYLSSPVVVQGTVFFGSGDGHVYAVDAVSGALRWKFKTGDVVHASPAVADGVVYVGSWDGALYALDARSGAQVWRFQGGLDPLMFNQQGFQASPAVVDGTVYVGCRDSNLYAIDARSGQEKWHVANGGSWVITSPAVSEGKVYFGTSDTSLYHVVEAASGTPVLQQSAQAYLFASPTIAGDVVLLGVLNGTLQARDKRSGELLWQFQTEAARTNAGWALTADGRINGALLYVTGWHDSMVNGATRQFAVCALFSTPLVVNGVVYVGSSDGRLYAIE